MNIMICRIIGNELPPRDMPGGKIETLRWILKHEPRDLPRFWVLNHLHDGDYRAKVIQLLREFDQPVDELVFEASRYAHLTNDRERCLYAINVNEARNHGIRCCAGATTFIACLDQECWCSLRQWSEVVRFIDADQRACPQRCYYGLRMKRIVDGDFSAADVLPDEEPQIIFRNDAPRLFDSAIPFGEGDKVELLSYLGYGSLPHFLLSGSACRDAGTVMHLAAGEERQEREIHFRAEQRSRSVEHLLRALDHRYRTPTVESGAANPKPTVGGELAGASKQVAATAGA